MIDDRQTPQIRRRVSIPLVWLLLITFDVSAVALTHAQSETGSSVAELGQQVAAETVGNTILEGNQNTPVEGQRFEAIDIFVDSGETPLAAYQFELTSQSDGVEIVGIEGGEHAAFPEPPYYDAKAMNSNRVILAAFSTEKALPTGKSRVARVHVQLDGPHDRSWKTTLLASATLDGQRIPAALTIARATRVQ